jgi:hypothetical protein
MRTQEPHVGWEERLDSQSLLELMKDQGIYCFRPLPHHSLGYPGLAIAMRPSPTGEHFDPDTVRLRLRNRAGIAAWTTLSWSSVSVASEAVCLGRAILSDRSKGCIEFYTFGGSLELIRGPDEVVVALRSPAPILELDPAEETVADQLACETEALLGKAEVAWGQDEQGFNQRLAEMDPVQLYIAALCSILHQYSFCGSLRETYRECSEALLREKHRLRAEGLWPANPPLLGDLLAPNSVV